MIERRGAPNAVLLSVRDYVRLAEARSRRYCASLLCDVAARHRSARGADKLTSREIDQEIQAARGSTASVDNCAAASDRHERRRFGGTEIGRTGAYWQGRRQQLLQLIPNRSVIVRPGFVLQVTSDRDDNKLLECARAATEGAQRLAAVFESVLVESAERPLFRADEHFELFVGTGDQPVIVRFERIELALSGLNNLRQHANGCVR